MELVWIQNLKALIKTGMFRDDERWKTIFLDQLDAINEEKASLRSRAEKAEAERDEAVRAQRVVQNAAKTLASAQNTELRHLRQNNAFDHRIRSEHESLLERDALMTDALLAAEATCEKLAKALEAAFEVLTAEDGCDLTPLLGSDNPNEHATGLVSEALSEYRKEASDADPG